MKATRNCTVVLQHLYIKLKSLMGFWLISMGISSREGPLMKIKINVTGFVKTILIGTKTEIQFI